MLKKSERLSRSEFTEFYGRGKRFHSPSLTLVYAPHSRFQGSAVISKKIAKTAVARNKFRRRVYAVYEREIFKNGGRGAFICIAKEKAPALSFSALQEELLSLIHKTGVLG